MAARVKRLYPTGAGAYLGTSLGTLVTASAAERIAIDKVSVSNHNAAERTITIQIIPSGQSASNAYRIVYVLPVEGNGNIDIPQMKHVLNPGDQIQALASAASSLTVYISGRVFT